MRGRAVFLGYLLLFGAYLIAQDVIDVSEQGISDGIRNYKQQDRDEAIMDARLKAIEKAGVNVQSVTTIENFQLKKDWIESKAQAYILPGFQIIDVGYGADGLYHVVLVGKVSVSLAQKGTKETGTEFIFIKGGTFQMGNTFDDGILDEKPVHTVTVGDFYLSKYEVTVAQYRAFCKTTDRSMPKAPPGGWMEKNPIVNVSWNDAEVFCQWAECRLSTEAEWEYAARGGRQSGGYKCSGSNKIDEVAWYRSNTIFQTHVVGTKKSNELGLYDMSGNVDEWCSDWYGKNYYNSSPTSNPQGPSSGSTRVLRGGSWLGLPRSVRCTYRDYSDPGGRSNNNGFRVAK